MFTLIELVTVHGNMMGSLQVAKYAYHDRASVTAPSKTLGLEYSKRDMFT